MLSAPEWTTPPSVSVMVYVPGTWSPWSPPPRRRCRSAPPASGHDHRPRRSASRVSQRCRHCSIGQRRQPDGLRDVRQGERHLVPAARRATVNRSDRLPASRRPASDGCALSRYDNPACAESGTTTENDPSAATSNGSRRSGISVPVPGPASRRTAHTPATPSRCPTRHRRGPAAGHRSGCGWRWARVSPGGDVARSGRGQQRPGQGRGELQPVAVGRLVGREAEGHDERERVEVLACLRGRTSVRGFTVASPS